MRRVQDAVSGRTHFQTKVNVVECYTEAFLIEATHLLKYRSTRHKTSAGDSADIPDHVGQVEIVPFVSWQAFKSVAAIFENAHDDTGVLYSPFRIQKLGAHRPNFGP